MATEGGQGAEAEAPAGGVADAGVVLAEVAEAMVRRRANLLRCRGAGGGVRRVWEGLAMGGEGVSPAGGLRSRDGGRRRMVEMGAAAEGLCGGRRWSGVAEEVGSSGWLQRVAPAGGSSGWLQADGCSRLRSAEANGCGRRKGRRRARRAAESAAEGGGGRLRAAEGRARSAGLAPAWLGRRMAAASMSGFGCGRRKGGAGGKKCSGGLEACGGAGRGVGGWARHRRRPRGGLLRRWEGGGRGDRRKEGGGMVWEGARAGGDDRRWRESGCGGGGGGLLTGGDAGGRRRCGPAGDGRRIPCGGAAAAARRRTGRIAVAACGGWLRCWAAAWSREVGGGGSGESTAEAGG
ncbi:hypothetical protein KP509_1Z106200 [Ceratopteris richardii]|nr:hypothetical protein KP509_1Z106200 [Ceratopteris richardii]